VSLSKISWKLLFAAFSKFNLSGFQKERERLEKMISQKMDQIFTSRMKNIEGSLSGNFSNLRNSLYETQNRVKSLEHCVLENADINYKDFKKKILKSSTGAENKENKEKDNRDQSGKKLKQSKTEATNQMSRNKSKPKKDEHIFVDNGESDFQSDHRRTSSPKRDFDSEDNPLSLKELQGTPSQNIRMKPFTSSLLPTKERDIESINIKKEKITMHLPESIRKVKEEIKKKIENYRSEMTPQKGPTAEIKYSTAKPVDKSQSRLPSYATHDPSRDSAKYTGKDSLNSRLGDSVVPSEELVQLLRKRGFQFNSNQK